MNKVPTALWVALAGCALVVVALCSPPVVRAVSRSSPLRQPPEQPEGLRLGTVTLHVPGLETLPPEGEAEGKLVRVRVLPSGRCVFTLRHMWIGPGIGLPAPGFMLDGSIRRQANEATVSVFVPLGSVVPIVCVWMMLMAGSAISLAITPSAIGLVAMSLVIASGYVTWRRAVRAVTLVSDDAVTALQQLRTLPATPTAVL